MTHKSLNGSFFLPTHHFWKAQLQPLFVKFGSARLVLVLISQRKKVTERGQTHCVIIILIQRWSYIDCAVWDCHHRPAGLAELLQDASQSALRVRLLRLNDLLNVIQPVLLQEQEAFTLWRSSKDQRSQHLPVFLLCCQSCCHCKASFSGPATSSWYRCMASSQNRASGSSFCGYVVAFIA